MMGKAILRNVGLPFALAVVLIVPTSSRGQTLVSRDDIINQLNRFEGAPALDVTALRHPTVACGCLAPTRQRFMHWWRSRASSTPP